jgi:hypothetical protein
MVAMLGFCMVFELLWLMPGVFFYVLALYSAVVRYEEAKLLKRFGRTYEAYVKKVPRWFPRVKVFSRQIRPIGWRLVIVGESRSWLLGAVVLWLAWFKEAML